MYISKYLRFYFLLFYNQLKYLMKKGPAPAITKTTTQPPKGKAPEPKKAFNPDDYTSLTLPR